MNSDKISPSTYSTLLIQLPPFDFDFFLLCPLDGGGGPDDDEEKPGGGMLNPGGGVHPGGGGPTHPLGMKAARPSGI